MTPKTEGETVTSLGLPFPCDAVREIVASERVIYNLRMTLCGSEVPQDRWRGRTAGSGMWTRTRDYLLSWSLDDPAIPYG